ncbi:MAG: flagellin [Pseudobdellovibrionaceae bacterium]
MGLRISTNVASINAQRSMAGSQREIQKAFSQLASGSRITKAADDAAGLSISENLKSTIRSMTQASRNANDGISMIQVAEGGLGEVSNILTRLRELGIQAASDTVGERERGFVNNEVQQLKAEMQRIAETSRYGNTNLLDGSGEVFDFQVGVNNIESQDRISFDAGAMNAQTGNLGVDGLDFSTKEGAQSALEQLDTAQVQVNGFRSTLGALQNRLISTSDNLGVTHENFSAANSRVRDADIAAATSEMTKNNILLNATTSVLAQANQFPALSMKLLG